MIAIIVDNMFDVSHRFEEGTIGARIKDHVITKSHKKAASTKSVHQLIPEVMQQMLEDDAEEESFKDRLLNAFVGANIPLNTLSNPTFRGFMSSEMKRKIPHPTTFRRSIPKLYHKKIEKIRKYFEGKDVFFVLTPDSQDRNVVNVMAGALDGTKPKIALVSVQFASRVNNQVIRQIILHTCSKIWK